MRVEVKFQLWFVPSADTNTLSRALWKHLRPWTLITIISSHRLKPLWAQRLLPFSSSYVCVFSLCGLSNQLCAGSHWAPFTSGERVAVAGLWFYLSWGSFSCEGETLILCTEPETLSELKKKQKKKTDSFWFPPLGWLSLENTEGDSLWWRRWQFLRICLCFNFLSLLNLAFILKMCSFRHPQPEFWSLFMRVQELAEVWILSLLKLWMSWEGEGRGWTPTEPPLSLPAPPVWAQEDQVSSCLLFKAAELFWSGSVD